MLGIHLERQRSALAAVEDGGNGAGDAKATRRRFLPLVSRGAASTDDLFHKSFPISKLSGAGFSL